MTWVRGWLVNITLIVVLIFAALWLRARTATAEDALCVLRGSLEQRVDDSVAYLADLDARRRQPIPGISRADIVRSIQSQRNTIRALSGLHC